VAKGVCDLLNPTTDKAGNESMQRRGAIALPPVDDFITRGIAISAIILFVGTGGATLSLALRALNGFGPGPDALQVCALLLNIALLLLGWSRLRALSQEVQARKEGEAEALHLARFDPLTGFLNRRGLDEAIANFDDRSGDRKEAFAVIVADLDRFKQVNDLYGHGAGDNVLRQCASYIAEFLPPRSIAARVGGDEFICIAPIDPAHIERVDDFAENLIRAMSSASHAEAMGPLDMVTVSIGISRSDTCQHESGSPPAIDHLIHLADMAMYQAKRQGRNRHVWYEPAMESELRVRRELEAGIRRGIVQGEFVPYYEQQVDLTSGTLTGFEMLARWESPTFGLVGPQVFIPIAEEIGVIDVLSQGLIAQALQDAKSWDPQLTLSVNISPVQLRDQWFAQKLIKLLVEANFPPQRLEVEITESCLHDNIGAVRALLASLKNQGIRISLDDFGTGYSSLGHLHELPIDCIKIDRSFITNLAANSDNAAIVQMITTLGKGLGLPIVAEGIESVADLAELSAYENFRGQGYLYGMPETATETSKRLAEMGLLASSGDQTGEPVRPATAAA
jgi:diguanylate cyclase (GGDEF)-like protein